MVGEPECRSDTECRTPEVCHTGSCVNACLVVRCGANAVCQTTVHDAICTCPPGYTGRPEEECRYSEYSCCIDSTHGGVETSLGFEKISKSGVFQFVESSFFIGILLLFDRGAILHFSH